MLKDKNASDKQKVEHSAFGVKVARAYGGAHTEHENLSADDKQKCASQDELARQKVAMR